MSVGTNIAPHWMLCSIEEVMVVALAYILQLLDNMINAVSNTRRRE